MKLSIVNFENKHDDHQKLVMTLHTEASVQTFKCNDGKDLAHYFYWQYRNNNNSSTTKSKSVPPLVSSTNNKIKKSTRKMSPPTPTTHFNCQMTTNSQQQIVYELSAVTNSSSPFNVSKRRRKQSLHSHEQVFSVNANSNVSSNYSYSQFTSSNSCSSSGNSSGGGSPLPSTSPKIKKQCFSNNVLLCSAVESKTNPSETQPTPYNTQLQKEELANMTSMTNENPYERSTSSELFVKQSPPLDETVPPTPTTTTRTTRIVRSSISIRELLN